MAPLSRRQVRLRREYLYRRSLEGAESEVYEKKRMVKEALASGKEIPSELRREGNELRRLIEFDDDRSRSTLDDEYARTLRGERMAKICVSTSRSPSSRLKQFSKELKHLIPNCTNVNRGTTKLEDLVEATRAADFSDLVMVHETRGQPDGLVVCHLPLGPTTYFTVSNCVLRHDLEDKAPNFSVDAAPHLIFHDFDDAQKPLARRIKTVLKCLFPDAKADAKRVLTFFNKDDTISVRHHHHSRQGKDVDLNELGPRFELTPYQIKLGTLDTQATNDTEWVLRPYLNANNKRVL